MELDRGERLLRASGTSYSLVVMAACAAVVSVGLLGRGVMVDMDAADVRAY